MNSCTVVSISNEKEYEEAFRLVHKKYLESNYIKEGEKISIQNYLQQEYSFTYAAYALDEMYGTASLVLDSKKGLPLEVVYYDEVNKLRRQGRKIAEAVQFAIDQDVCKKKLAQAEVFFAAVPLFARVLKDAYYAGVDTLFISVNPKHVSFYHKFGFTQFGEERHYEAVSAPAIGMQLQMSSLSDPVFRTSMIGRKITDYIFP